MRVRSGPVTTRRRRKVIKAAKGYLHGRSKLYRLAKQATMKAGTNAATGRKLKKRDFRSIWIVRLNNALKEQGLRYNAFIKDKNSKQILLNRKVLSELAINNPDVFKDLATKISKSSLNSKPITTGKKEPSVSAKVKNDEVQKTEERKKDQKDNLEANTTEK